MGANEYLLAGAQTGVNAIGQLASNLINEPFVIRSENRAWSKQMEMYERQYKDNSPAARLKQLEDAGLSASLMYGSTGAGGGSADSATAPRGQATSDMRVAQIMEVRQAEANINLMNANADKARIEAAKTAGVDTKLSEANVLQITANIEKLKADTSLTNSIVTGKQIGRAHV